MQEEIEWRVPTTITQITQFGALLELPLDPFISSSARKSSCAFTEVAASASIEGPAGACIEGPEEPRAIKGVLVDGNQQYPMDFLSQCTTCELYKPFDNITTQV
jgi:hypothetical protein